MDNDPQLRRDPLLQLGLAVDPQCPRDVNLPDFQLADVMAGTYDSYIREFAEDARDWGHPFFLRFNWEMNGNWFPWGESVNGNQPGEYVAAWRHVHDIFTSVGATNATWVWCPYADGRPQVRAAGAALPRRRLRRLDLHGRLQLGRATPPTHIPGGASTDLRHDLPRNRQAHRADKPMVLAEMASTGKPPRQGQPGSTTCSRCCDTKYRRIRGLIWFDQIDRGIDWPLETSPPAARAFARGIRKRGFRPNVHAAISASPIQPPR